MKAHIIIPSKEKMRAKVNASLPATTKVDVRFSVFIPQNSRTANNKRPSKPTIQTRVLKSLICAFARLSINSCCLEKYLQNRKSKIMSSKSLLIPTKYF